MPDAINAFAEITSAPLMLPLPPAAVVIVPTVNVPVILALPAVKLPVTATLVSVPTEVIFGCAAVYTVPATNALPT